MKKHRLKFEKETGLRIEDCFTMEDYFIAYSNWLSKKLAKLETKFCTCKTMATEYHYGYSKAVCFKCEKSVNFKKVHKEIIKINEKKT